MSNEQRLSELLNSRHEDLNAVFNLMYHTNNIKNTLGKDYAIQNELESISNSLQDSLVKKLDIELEEVAEDEEVELDELDFEMIGGAIEVALLNLKRDMSSYLQFDRTLKALKTIGLTDEELEKLPNGKKRLEENLFSKYDITEEDLKEEDSDE